MAREEAHLSSSSFPANPNISHSSLSLACSRSLSSSPIEPRSAGATHPQAQELESSTFTYIYIRPALQMSFNLSRGKEVQLVSFENLLSHILEIENNLRNSENFKFEFYRISLNLSFHISSFHRNHFFLELF